VSGPPNLFWRAANGSGKPEQLTNSPNPQLPEVVTPDGSHLIFAEIATTQGDSNLMIMPLTGERRPQPLIATSSRDRNAALTPDGRWLAYESNKSNRDEIWVTPFPVLSTNGEWKVSVQGGTRPRWVSNDELAFIEPGEGEGRLMSVAMRASNGALEPAPPVQIFDTLDRYTLFPTGRTFDFSADGRRVLTVRSLPSSATEPESAPKMVLIQNWIEELKRRVVAR
jgi:hypothetical protein